jgi:hypothetical protein
LVVDQKARAGQLLRTVGGADPNHRRGGFFIHSADFGGDFIKNAGGSVRRGRGSFWGARHLHLGDLHFLHHDGFGYDRARVLFLGKASESHPPGRDYAEDEEGGKEEFRT